MRVATAIAALVVSATSAIAQVQGVALDDPVEIPVFEMFNENGDTYSQQDLQGKWTILMFGFLSCPDVCPFTLENLEAAISETGMRVRPDNVPQVVFLSVDPDRDFDYISTYGPFFHPNFHSFTAARDDIDLLIETTDSYYRLMPPDADGYYDVQHSSAVSVISPDGMLRAKLQPPFDPGH